jgi:catechol 2,3-dioxygenase-like lactoylglutathione lyase family enzyme
MATVLLDTAVASLLVRAVRRPCGSLLREADSADALRLRRRGDNALQDAVDSALTEAIMTAMRIGHIELFVRDPLASREFYQRVLGFDVVAVQGANVWLKLGDVEILLRPGLAGRGGGGGGTYAGAASGIVLYVDDLPAAQAQLEARGLTFDGCDGGAKCPTFRDPDGHWFQLVNPNDH